MTRVDYRVSAPRTGGSYGGFSLSVIDLNQGLREYLPGAFIVDGSLVDGSLVFMGDSDGNHHVLDTGRNKDNCYDLIVVPHTYVGVPISEPIAPLTVTATCEPGLIQFDAVPRYELIPRRLVRDAGVRRIRDILREGECPRTLADRCRSNRGLVTSFEYLAYSFPGLLLPG